MGHDGEAMGFDPNTPNVARLYDYYLGGKDNFPADREAADRILAVAPELRMAARENRAFLGRAVRRLAREGITQFLDIGTGLPTRGNVHEVAAEVAPGARVVYVDNDPVVLAHARALLSGGGDTTVVQGDLRRPEGILRHRDVLDTIDFSRPVGLLLVAIMHFIRDADDPAGILRTLRSALAPGSYLVLSHGNREARAAAVQAGTSAYERATSPLVLRTRAEIMAMFEEFELVDPGLVWVSEWDGEDQELMARPEESLLLCGVGRKV
ncbi:O-Methyltransferase involved in polyketide biosynthesis [Sinosporangium album]|uniref:O-Methyltransferase involved in polyketide biosynthesis n=1 Tax=Sinosporangium album TaxID=504805 RepID=A0A1G7UYK5_9ACTN|nr:SAM-dependent methyltransferase [Sinosporangium album]SDG52209.1 O-Methyltransferase involved in polyketide biosynthesis [Sinosporangium album]